MQHQHLRAAADHDAMRRVLKYHVAFAPVAAVVVAAIRCSVVAFVLSLFDSDFAAAVLLGFRGFRGFCGGSARCARWTAEAVALRHFKGLGPREE